MRRKNKTVEQKEEENLNRKKEGIIFFSILSFID